MDKKLIVQNLEDEQAAIRKIDQMIADHLPEIDYCWKFGDGQGGGILERMNKQLTDAGLLNLPSNRPPMYAKKSISGAKRIRVFERDKYRCIQCQTHLDLTVDHIHPERKGGTLDMENLQTLCRSCNSRKGVKQ